MLCDNGIFEREVLLKLQLQAQQIDLKMNYLKIN